VKALPKIAATAVLLATLAALPGTLIAFKHAVDQMAVSGGRGLDHFAGQDSRWPAVVGGGQRVVCGVDGRWVTADGRDVAAEVGGG